MQEIPKLIVGQPTQIDIMLRDDETAEMLAHQLMDRYELRVEPCPSGNSSQGYNITPLTERGRSQFIGWYTHDGVPWREDHGRRKVS